MNEITGYILLYESNNKPVVDLLSNEIAVYPRIEHALIEANKTVIRVKAVKCKVIYES